MSGDDQRPGRQSETTGRSAADPCFHGRETEIREVLNGPRNAIWIVAARQMGKSSFLRELERRTWGPPQIGYQALYWNLGDTETAADLDRGFRQALARASPRLDSIGIQTVELEASSYAQSIRLLRRRLGTTGARLLLLCDDAEGLVRLGERDDAARILGKLRRTLLAGEGLRAVVASTIRLWQLRESPSRSSGFLDGLNPPLYLSPLGREDSAALISQVARNEDPAAAVDTPMVKEIQRICGGHPGLLTRLAQAAVQAGDLEQARRRVAADPVVRSGFAADLEATERLERAILFALAEQSDDITVQELGDRLGAPPEAVRGGLHTLAALGLAAGLDAGRPAVANRFLQEWLRDRPESSSMVSGGRPTSSLGESESRLDRVATILAESSPSGEVARTEELFELVYAELHERARRQMMRERPSHTLQATALVHEAYLKLADRTRMDWRGRSHFLAVGAQAMRRVLIDHARGRGRDKRGGAQLRVSLHEGATPSSERNLDFEELLSLHRELERLAETDERQARIVELRFFAGLTMDEIAHALGVSKRTVETDWTAAREWLKNRLLEGPSE